MAPYQEANELAITNQPVDQFNVEDEKLAARKVDDALQFLRAEEGGVVEVDGRKLSRKIDLMVMPLMFGAYLRSGLTRSSLTEYVYANAAIVSTSTRAC